MSTSTIKATIDRRILVNYRVDPDALSMILPKSFRPALVGGFGSPESASSGWAERGPPACQPH